VNEDEREEREGIETSSSARRTSWTAKDLLEVELPEARCAVDGLITEGLTFECGAPKIGKSWLGLGLGIAVASGGYAFGKIKVEKGEVLYLALEDNPRRLQTRLRMLLGEDSPPDGLYIETEWERLDQGGLERLEAWLEGHPTTRLVVIDVWTRVRPFTQNNSDRYQSDYEAASAVQALGVRHGVALVALYHTRKAESSDFVETVQGTFGTAGAADTIIVIKRSRGQADATLYVTGRDIEERELALQFTPDTGTWSLLGDAAEYGLAQTRKEVRDLVEAHGELTPKKVSELSSITWENAKVTMWRMANDGQLTATDGTYSIPLQTPVTAVTALPDGLQSYSGYSSPERGQTPVPILSDDGYDVALADAVQAGHITAIEFKRTLAVHRLVERAREAT
jgi:AAA domain